MFIFAARHSVRRVAATGEPAPFSKGVPPQGGGGLFAFAVASRPPIPFGGLIMWLPLSFTTHDNDGRPIAVAVRRG
jgi:hypothetical protein